MISSLYSTQSCWKIDDLEEMEVNEVMLSRSCGKLESFDKTYGTNG